VGCPDSDRMIEELRQQMTSGGSDTAIMNCLQRSMGLSCWLLLFAGARQCGVVAPIAVFLILRWGLVFDSGFWKLRSGARTPVSAAGSSVDEGEMPMRERIRRETEY